MIQWFKNGASVAPNQKWVTNMQAGSYSHFDLIYVVVAQFVMKQFKMGVV